jgi:hypothetical protein
MTEAQFNSALDNIALLYFNEEYDEFNPSLNASNRPVEEKRVLMYQLIN